MAHLTHPLESIADSEALVTMVMVKSTSSSSSELIAAKPPRITSNSGSQKPFSMYKALSLVFDTMTGDWIMLPYFCTILPALCLPLNYDKIGSTIRGTSMSMKWIRCQVWHIHSTLTSCWIISKRMLVDFSCISDLTKSIHVRMKAKMIWNHL